MFPHSSVLTHRPPSQNINMTNDPASGASTPRDILTPTTSTCSFFPNEVDSKLRKKTSKEELLNVGNRIRSYSSIRDRLAEIPLPRTIGEKNTYEEHLRVALGKPTLNDFMITISLSPKSVEARQNELALKNHLNEKEVEAGAKSIEWYKESTDKNSSISKSLSTEKLQNYEKVAEYMHGLFEQLMKQRQAEYQRSLYRDQRD